MTHLLLLEHVTPTLGTRSCFDYSAPTLSQWRPQSPQAQAHLGNIPSLAPASQLHPLLCFLQHAGPGFMQFSEHAVPLEYSLARLSSFRVSFIG